MSDKPSVVLVHGGFVDGSGWQGVYDLLTADGYQVSIVQNPTLSLEGDAAATRMILDRQDGPTILVGHSYGGAVISEAGTHERVAGLVYICAFAPDAGESVNTLIGTFPTDGPSRRSCLRRGLPLPRPRKVPPLVRRRPTRAAGNVLRRLASSVGRGGPGRHDQ